MKPKNILQRVLKFARTELERRARPQDELPSESLFEHDELDPADETADLRTRSQPRASTGERDDRAHEPEVFGLELARPHDGGALLLRWSLSDDDISRAERLIQGQSVLCLRVVSFSKARDDVLREVQDRPGVERVGQCELGEPPQRGVISLGLRSGERFVSIAHHVL
jgi:hypothetical protein